MTNTLNIDAELKNSEKTPRAYRSEGKLTGTIYGKDMESISVAFDRKSFVQGYNSRDLKIKLNVNKKSYEVQVQNVQENYRTGEKLNVEFKVV